METKELLALVRGSAGISIDSRSVKNGEIFFALRGPTHDGNRHASAALEAGAAAAVVDDHLLTGDSFIMVDNVLNTLSELAKCYRTTLSVPVIAITGTNGKTTTKELITAVLSKKKRVHATAGNLNNHIGVPLTLLSAPDDSGYLVVEMGANHMGEIAALCEIAMPTHGIITNIGKAHIEGFGSLENVKKTKAELYHWLRKSGGVAIYNENSSTLKELIFKIVHKAVPYSDPCGTDLIVKASGTDSLFLNVVADFRGHNYAFATSLFGSYNIDNVRAAMAVGILLEIPITDIIDAISAYKPSNNRSQVVNTGKNVLVCDSYNANPSSMERAIASFAAMKAEKKIIILGDMLELGPETLTAHAEIVGQLLLLEGIEVALVGPLFSRASAGRGIRAFSTIDEINKWLESTPPQGAHILVKGSRGMMLEKIYPLL
jgi:UDP-N-acetylmuramoyl-tripeptide--D-alanyl-D-alanine ligase